MPDLTSGQWKFTAHQRAGVGVWVMLVQPHLLLAHIAEVVVVGKVLEKRQEGASNLAKTVLALVGHQDVLADLHNVSAPAFDHLCTSSSLGSIHSLDLGRKRQQDIVLAAAPLHVGRALHHERLLLLALWRNIKKLPCKVQALLELLLVVVAALEEATSLMVVAVGRHSCIRIGCSRE